MTTETHKYSKTSFARIWHESLSRIKETFNSSQIWIVHPNLSLIEEN